MTDDAKTRQQLIEEFCMLQAKIAELEKFHQNGKKPDSPAGLWQALIEAIPIPIYYKNIRGIYTGCNTSFERFIKLRKDQIIGKNVYDLAPARLADTYQKMDRSLFENPGIQVYESEVQDISGTLHSVIFHKATFNTPDESPGGLIGIIIDVTEQRKAEADLKEALRISQKYLDVAAVMFLVIDASQNVTLINKKGCEILGRGEGEIVGKNWFDLAIETSCRNELQAEFDRLMAGKGNMAEYVEHPVIAKTGEKRVIAWHTALLTDSNGKITGLLCSGQDVTEHLRADQALLESEERLRTILASLQSGILIIDPQSHTIVDANPMAARLIGVSREDLIGQTCHKHVCPAEKGKCPITDLGQTIDDSERVLLCSDGRRIAILKTVITVAFNGRPHLIEQFIDISERKEMEQSLARSLKIKTAMTELSHSLLSSSSLQQIPSLVLEHARNLTESAEGFVGLIDPETGRLMDGALSQDKADIPDKAHPVMEKFEAAYGRAAEPGKTIVLNRRTDGGDSDRFLSVPAIFEDLAVGSIVLVNSERDYAGADIEIVGRMADLYAIAVSRMRLQEELHRLSITDQLTGLKNRRGFINLAEQQLKLANRAKTSLALSFCDLDGLKWINDTLGHEEGDRAIIDAAGILKKSFRESDIIARLAGDEFAVLAMDISEADAQIMAARLADHIQEFNRLGNRAYQLSISAGTAYYHPETPCSLDALMAEADRLMYRQKQNKAQKLHP